MENTESQDLTPNTKKQPQDYDFSKGYQNGLYGVEKNSYQNFLEGNIRSQTLAYQIADRIEEKKSLEDRLQQIRLGASHFNERLQMHRFNLETNATKTERLQHQLSQSDEQLLRYRTEKQEKREDYSLLAGIIFVVAGAIFMAGDLIISHEIVAYALNIRNTTEAWLFAGGLAALSILFKPVYDRIFEKSFKANENIPRKYLWLKGSVVIFALLTLFVLGWFRFEAYRINEQKSNINRLINTLQTEDMKPETIAQVEKLLATQQSLGMQLVNSLWGLFAFVLTGILFAISGAICLGIGLPILQFYWRHWVQIPIKITILKNRGKRTTRKVEKQEALLAREKTHYEICSFEIQTHTEKTTLENRLATLREDLNDLLQQKMAADMESRVSLYQDGYESGFALQQGENRFVEEAVSPSHESDNRLIVKELPLKNKSQRNRPYLALRQMIFENLRND
ncbi:MAG: hypothetical protein H7Y04_15070 [Verrucomicrobia bacterium]|nr:hypothetical protein [Cytophagales bacterium]